MRLVAMLAILIAGLGFGVAPVIGDGLPGQPSPASPVNRPTVLASVPQSAAAGSLARVSGNRQIVLTSRVTKDPVVTEAGKGTFAGINCPKGSKAVSGGVISGYINLLISSSSPNNPLSGRYTPRTWWLTVTNADVDGQGGSLSWRGVVNCLSPLTLGS